MSLEEKARSVFDVQEELKRKNCEFRKTHKAFDMRAVYCGTNTASKALFCRYRGAESVNLLGKFYKPCSYP